MSVFVVRAFLRMRSLLSNKRELAKQLEALEKELKQRVGVHEAAIVTILHRALNIIDQRRFLQFLQNRESAFVLKLHRE
jgi:hypothetical protein